LEFLWFWVSRVSRISSFWNFEFRVLRLFKVPSFVVLKFLNLNFWSFWVVLFCDQWVQGLCFGVLQLGRVKYRCLNTKSLNSHNSTLKNLHQVYVYPKQDNLNFYCICRFYLFWIKMIFWICKDVVGQRLGSFGSEHGTSNRRVQRFEDVMGSEPAEWDSILPAYLSPCTCYSWRACHTTFVHHFLHRSLLCPWILLNVFQFMCRGIKLVPQEKVLDCALPTKF